MLIKPDLADKEITECLQDEYALRVDKISFLPLGADLDTAVYRVTTSDGMDYFLKLRRGAFNKAAVLLPKYLADLGIKQVIPPLATKSGQLWAGLASFSAILYPYIEGSNGIERKLSDRQWMEFGTALKGFHSVNIPPAITNSVQKETFSSKWRESVKTFLERVEDEIFEEPVAAEMALFLKYKRREILKIVNRTENLASLLQKQPLEYILCHGDIHGWNLLIDKDGELYLVDWDTIIFAPKERDLMFVGAGIGDTGRTPIEEETLFYKGYGQTNINQDAIAYYRYERVIEDIGVYCEQIFLSDQSEGEEDRIQSFEYLRSNFLPNGTIERAYDADNGKL